MRNTHAPKEFIIPAPELRGAAFALGACRDLEVCLDGPAGSGKTLAALFKIHIGLLLYPNSKALIMRKTNTALTGSALATYRAMIQPQERIVYFGGNKVKPAAFQYPNGSLLLVSGLDHPEKIKSMEIDRAYINEALECTQEDIEFVRSRMRNGKTPYHQLIMDVNPGPPTHWLNQRMNAGITTRLVSVHKDNPRYFDTVTNDWTAEGKQYIFETLAGLTGVRRARLFLGQWASAEGGIYEDVWNPAIHLIDRFTIPAAWPRYLSVDFGFTHAFVCQWHAEDPDGRLYRYREIYKTKTLVEDHAKVIRDVSRWGQDGGDPIPRAVICDHDAEDRATLERYLNLYTISAHKAVSPGLQAVAVRMRPAGDGKPRIFLLRDSLVERDPELVDKKLPTCTEEEIEGYRWDTRQGMKKGDQPIKEMDHGCDGLRYACSHLDLGGNDRIEYGAQLY